MIRIPMVFMRGETGKGLFFHEKDLPENIEDRKALILKAMGHSDIKQIDGMGGGVSSTNKVVSVEISKRQNVDIEYTVYLPSMTEDIVEMSNNCGSISTAVAPFAIDEGLLNDIEEGEITVNMYNTNTKKIVKSTVIVGSNGKVNTKGDFKIDGVNGTSSPIKLEFLEPAGAQTGKLFPTGNKRDLITIDDFGDIEVTIIDSNVPTVILKAESINMTGTETLLEIDNNKMIMTLLENIRCKCAKLIGLDDNGKVPKSTPKIGICTTPKSYKSISGENVSNMDLCTRVLSIGKTHRSIPIGVVIAISSACSIEGTIPYQLSSSNSKKISLGHPMGIINTFPSVSENNIDSITVIRTARRIADGHVYIDE